MKNKLKSTLTIILVLVLFTQLELNDLEAQTSTHHPSAKFTYIPHPAIEITSDADFNTTYSFPGTGTELDPFIIEGYNITTTDNLGISIAFTTKHFIIRDCYIDAGNVGISISTVGSGTAQVLNNICLSNKFAGISLFSVTAALVAYNNCSLNSEDGIQIVYCDDIVITDNICQGNINSGIAIYHSSSVETINNTCNNNQWGTSFSGCTDPTIVDNTCDSNSNQGIVLQYSFGANVTGNSCSDNNYGFYLININNSVISENICNENKNGVGIRLQASWNIELIENDCNSNDFYGIFISSSYDCTLTKNSYLMSNVGIFMDNTNSCTVTENDCSYSNVGILLMFSTDISITNNTIVGNGEGIKLKDESNACTISYNLLELNAEHGVCITGSNDSVIHHNKFIDNYMFGTSQAYDDGYNNTWYEESTLEGNYWNTWSGTGNYTIDGAANSVDPYPIAEIIIPEYSTKYIFLSLLMTIGLVIISYTTRTSRVKK